MKDYPLVSVIMNCLNCEKYVKEAIDSVYAQTYPNWEIIFWDNASTDRSAEIAKSYDERLRYFRSKETVPLGKARNWALEQAKGEYIAFLDSDDIWFPQKLEKQIPLFEKNPRVGLVFCDTIFFNDKRVSYRLYGRKKPSRGQIFRELLKSYFLSLETVVIRRNVLNNLNGGWFDERFNVVEEADLFIRIAHDYEADYVDEPLAKWRMHEESWSFIKKELFSKESELMLQKFCALYDNFEKQFKKEILIIQGRIQYRYAMLDWERGENRLVRKRLFPYLKVLKRFWIPYILSFLPYKFYMQLGDLYRASRSKLR